MTCEGHLQLTREEARGLMLAAQGLLDRPAPRPSKATLLAQIERLGAVQIDTISVVERSQYLVLWSRLGRYDRAWLDSLLHPGRTVFEYWSHAASIVPMSDYSYYRPKMLRYVEHMWPGNHAWLQSSEDVMRLTLEAIRERGALASSDFERPAGAERSGPWNWYGVKESRRALEVLWTTGELMIHSRRGGQKRYDLRERVLAEAFGWSVPGDEELPTLDERLRYFTARTVRALGVVVPSWIWDYFRLPTPEAPAASKRACATRMLDDLVATGHVVTATVAGLSEPAYVDRGRLSDLERLRAGLKPLCTTLLSPFDSLIWDRARARALFDYEVCFEAYVPPPRRRYGYYCLAILHRGRLVGRLDPKMDRASRRLGVRAVYLEPGVRASGHLLDGLARSLVDLARFLGGDHVTVERSEPSSVAAMLAERLVPSPPVMP